MKRLEGKKVISNVSSNTCSRSSSLLLFSFIAFVFFFHTSFCFPERRNDIHTRDFFNKHSPHLASDYSIDNVMKSLEELERIAYEVGGGNRAAGTKGYNASVDYVVEYLKKNTNFTVTTQYFPFYHYKELSVPTLSQLSPETIEYIYDVDFTALRNSFSGDVIAPIQSGGECCTEEEMNEFKEGNIAVCVYDGCSIESKVSLAISYNASAVLIINNPGDGVNSGTLDQPADRIVFGLRYEIGQSILATLSSSPSFHAFASIQLIQDYTMNIIADSPSPSPPPSSSSSSFIEKKEEEIAVVIFGSHLDSVEYGPGMNDDGSGSSALLELARSYSSFIISEAGEEVVNKVRLCWFGAEELGKIGSHYYVNSLISSNTLSPVAAYYNFDMIASPNFYRGVFNGTTTPLPLNGPSTKLQILLDDYFEFSNLTYRLISFGEGSDYYWFLQNGVPASGLHTGTDLPKPPLFRSMFGGIALAGFDPCYHDPCDTVLNINPSILDQNGKAAYYVATTISRINDLPSYLNDPSPPPPRSFLLVDDYFYSY